MISTTADQLGIEPSDMKKIISTTPEVMGDWGFKDGYAKNLSAYMADIDDDGLDSKEYPKTVKLTQMNNINPSERFYKKDKKGRMVRLEKPDGDSSKFIKFKNYLDLYKKGYQTNNSGAGGMGNPMLPGQI